MKITWFIDEWRSVWRFSSVWIAGIGFGVLMAWNQMPEAVRYLVPDWLELATAGVLWVLIILARITRQPNSEKIIKAKLAMQETGQ